MERNVYADASDMYEAGKPYRQYRTGFAQDRRIEGSMRITSRNLKDIKALYLHDFTFSGFHYDYDQGKLNLKCEKSHLRKGMKLEFENVIGIHMQACGFWGGGNSILGIYPGDGYLLERYRETAQINKNFDFADLIDPENEFVEFEIEINSGGNLLVVCEALHAEEFPL